MDLGYENGSGAGQAWTREMENWCDPPLSLVALIAQSKGRHGRNIP